MQADFTTEVMLSMAYQLAVPDITLGDGAHSVFAGGGTALVVHAKADDGKTDPSGNSGDRIACGVITK